MLFSSFSPKYSKQFEYFHVVTLSSLLSRYVELARYMLPDTAVGLPSAETETDDDDSGTRGKEKTARTS